MSIQENPEKIKIITDSACDLPREDEESHPNLEILSIPITVDGKGYYERKDFLNEEFYPILNQAASIPSTSHIPSAVFADAYERAVEEGYNCLIVITISGKASSMYTSASMAKEEFYQNHPDKQIPIHVIDSRTFSIVYGYAILHALEQIREGASCQQLLDYFQDYFDSIEVYFGLFNLDYAKKSGRISCMAAFLGEVLGLRPIISIIDGELKVAEKVRGDRNVPVKMAQWYVKRSVQPDFPYVTLEGEALEQSAALNQALEEAVGYPSQKIYKVGASVAINSGTTIIGVMVKGVNRRKAGLLSE